VTFNLVEISSNALNIGAHESLVKRIQERRKADTDELGPPVTDHKVYNAREDGSREKRHSHPADGIYYPRTP
jgi:hypothetical protein